MRAFLEYLKSVLVSFEALVVLLAVAIAKWNWFDVAVALSDLELDDDQLKYLSLIPIALLVGTFAKVRRVLFPDDASKGRLQRWAEYWKFRIVCNVALAYSVAFALVAVAAWLVPVHWLDSHSLLVILTASLGAGICSLSVYNAEIRIKEEFARS